MSCAVRSVELPLQPYIQLQDMAVVHLAPRFGSGRLQGVSLVLSSYQAWRYHPEGGSLRALASNVHQRLASFKNSELATAIEAFSALGFHPGNDLVQVSKDTRPSSASQALLAGTAQM